MATKKKSVKKESKHGLAVYDEVDALKTKVHKLQKENLALKKGDLKTKVRKLQKENRVLKTQHEAIHSELMQADKEIEELREKLDSKQSSDDAYNEVATDVDTQAESHADFNSETEVEVEEFTPPTQKEN